MTEIRYFDDVFVELIASAARDADIVEAARVSTKGADSLGDGASAGLINYLMKGRHGSPFEHTHFKFLVKAPIFVFREFHRHRVGFSYNEMSGRYTELRPNFYIPHPARPLQQVGKPGHYEFEAGSAAQYDVLTDSFLEVYTTAWANYQIMLSAGIAKEVARMVLPVGIFSEMYVTCNARSLMHFLGLRTEHPDATFKSTPQQEIQMVADKMELALKDKMPITHAAFCRNGRVAP